MHVFTYTFKHNYVHILMSTHSMYAHRNTYAYTYIRLGIIDMNTCMLKCTHIQMHYRYKYIYAQMYIHTITHAHIHSCVLQIQAHAQIYVKIKYTNTIVHYIHTYMHTYIHTYTQCTRSVQGSVSCRVHLCKLASQ